MILKTYCEMVIKVYFYVLMNVCDVVLGVLFFVSKSVFKYIKYMYRHVKTRKMDFHSKMIFRISDFRGISMCIRAYMGWFYMKNRALICII